GWPWQMRPGRFLVGLSIAGDARPLAAPFLPGSRALSLSPALRPFCAPDQPRVADLPLDRPVVRGVASEWGKRGRRASPQTTPDGEDSTSCLEGLRPILGRGKAVARHDASRNPTV